MDLSPPPGQLYPCEIDKGLFGADPDPSPWCTPNRDRVPTYSMPLARTDSCLFDAKV